MTETTKSQASKAEIQQRTIAAINKQSRLGGTIPYQLPALIAVAPTYITDHLIRAHLHGTLRYVVVLGVFLIVQRSLGLYLRSFLRKHPALKWQILIH